MRSFKNLVALLLCGALSFSAVGCLTDSDIGESEVDNIETVRQTSGPSLSEEPEGSEAPNEHEDSESFSSAPPTSDTELPVDPASPTTASIPASPVWLIDVTDEAQLRDLIYAMEAGYPEVGDAMSDAMTRLEGETGYCPISWELSNNQLIQFDYVARADFAHVWGDEPSRDFVMYLGYNGYEVNDDDAENAFIGSYNADMPRLWASAVLIVYSAEDAAVCYDILSSCFDGLYGGESSDEEVIDSLIHHVTAEDGREATIMLFTDEIDTLGYCRVFIDLSRPMAEA